jgi:hypothetical protein
MKKIFLFLIITILSSCNWLKEKTKESINKSGEIVSKTGSEFIDGASKGVEKTFQNKIELSDELKKFELEAGKVIINNSEYGTDNILTVYLIFGENFEKNITVKVFDENNQEYGRITKSIKGNKGEAKYFDFEFDKRTNINGKGKITFE